MIVIVEVEPDESLIKELDITRFILCDRQTFHQDLHSMLEAMPDGLKFLGTLFQSCHKVSTGNFEETHAFSLIFAHSTAASVSAASVELRHFFVGV